MSQWGSRGPYYVDNFGSLSGDWTAHLGTFAAAGTLTAATIAVDGINLVPNPEFTTNIVGWSIYLGAVLNRRDYTAAPAIAPTGGIDDYGIEVASGGSNLSAALGSMVMQTGRTYTATCRAYAPSVNTAVNVAQLRVYDRLGILVASDAVAGEDVWETLTATGLVVNGSHAAACSVRLRCASATAGDLAHFDRVWLQQHRAIATLSTWAYADGTYSFDVAMPAAGVVPVGYAFRYTNPSNCWLVQLRPGTAGNDLFLYEVNAGVMTARISADVDWGTSVTDHVRVGLDGASITLYRKLSGAGAWTNAGTYGAAALNQAVTAHGPLLYSTIAGVTAITRVEYRP